MNSISKVEFRYQKRIYLIDDFKNKYVLFFNQETRQEILTLLVKFKLNKISPNKQLNLINLYNYALSKNYDWLLLTKKEFENISPKKRKKLIKRKKR